MGQAKDPSTSPYPCQPFLPPPPLLLTWTNLFHHRDTGTSLECRRVTGVFLAWFFQGRVAVGHDASLLPWALIWIARRRWSLKTGGFSLPLPRSSETSNRVAIPYSLDTLVTIRCFIGRIYFHYAGHPDDWFSILSPRFSPLVYLLIFFFSIAIRTPFPPFFSFLLGRSVYLGFTVFIPFSLSLSLFFSLSLETIGEFRGRTVGIIRGW